MAVGLLSDRVGLRPLTRDDLPAVLAWNQNQEIVALMGQTMTTEEDLVRWWHDMGVTAGRLAFAVLLNGRLIGEVDLEHISWRSLEAEVRICIGYTHLWNKGYGTEALSRLLVHSYGHLGLRLVYLRVLEHNVRAIKSYEKLGFKKRARLMPTGHLAGGSAVWLMELDAAAFFRRQEHAYGQIDRARSASCMWAADE